VFLWASGSWRPNGSIDREAIRDLWKFSANLAAFNAVNFWSRNADNLLVGRFVNPCALGLYSRAYSLMLLPLNQITSTVSVAMYPVLARLQHDRVRVRSAYLRVVNLVALASLPMAAGLFVAAHPFVVVVFGQRWEGVAKVLQILCVTLLVQSVGSTVGLIYQVTGRTDWLFRWGLGASIITVASFAIGVHWGITGVAYSYAIVSVGMLYFNFAVPGKLIGLHPTEIARTVSGPLGASLVMALIAWLAGRALAGLGPGAQLAIEFVVGAAVYAAIAHGLSLRAFVDLKGIARRDGFMSVEPER
jgi:PST family polysaccharide transporter